MNKFILTDGDHSDINIEFEKTEPYGRLSVEAKYFFRLLFDPSQAVALARFILKQYPEGGKIDGK